MARGGAGKRASDGQGAGGASRTSKRARSSTGHPQSTPVTLEYDDKAAGGSLTKPLTSIEQAAIAQSSTTIVYDTWPSYADIRGGDGVLKLEARHGCGETLVGFLSSNSGTTDAAAPAGPVSVSVLATPATLLLIAGALAQLSSLSSISLVVHVASNSSNIAELFESLALISSSTLHDFKGEILFSGGRGAKEIIANAAAAYANYPGKTVINVCDDVEAGQEYSLLPAFGSPSIGDAAAAFSYSGPTEPHSVLVLPSVAHAGTATAALRAIQSNPASSKVGIITVGAVTSDVSAFAQGLASNIPKSVQTVFAPTASTDIDETAGWFYETVLASIVTESGKIAASVFPLGLCSAWCIQDWAATLVRLSSPSSSKAFASPKIESLLPPTSKLAIFWSSDSGASSNVPAAVAHSFARLAHASEGGVAPRLLEAFDNTAGGKSSAGLGVKSSELLLSPLNTPAADDVPLSSLALTAAPGLVFVSAPQFVLPSYNAIERAGPDTQILFSSAWNQEQFSEKLPKHERNKLHSHKHIYAINAEAVAKSVAGRNINNEEVVSLVEQIAFWHMYLSQSEESPIASLLSTTLPVKTVTSLIDATRAALVRIDLSNTDMDIDEEDAARPNHQLAPGEQDASVLSHPAFIPVAKAAYGPNPFRSIPEPPVAASNWHLAAKQLLYPEAYSTPSTDDAQTMRPDLPEQNYIVTVTENRRLTPLDYDRNVFHIEFSTVGTGLKYAVGEALGVHGLNDTQEVMDFIEWYGLDPETLVSYPSRTDASGKLEVRTVFQLFQQTLDIFGKPPKSFYEVLSKHATNREEQRHLRFLSSAEGASTFRKWSELETVTYADVLKSFPSAKANFGIPELMREVAAIKPRHYSIASSQNAVGDSVHLLVVTVDWDTPGGSKRYGQCTRYLAGLPVGAKVMVSIKPSVMKLPPRDTQPIIMAGLGTGAAPFRAFMQERAWQRDQGINVGPLLYYFGARYRHAEYLYGEEIEAYIRDSVITHAGLAFSRDGKKKHYIQHSMAADGRLLGDSLDEGVFYLCGPTWPVPDVYKCLTEALTEHRGKTTEQAEAHIEELKEAERYVLEVY